ncbi:unnamed protein product [Ilex paraguariensis]|uniref:DUF1308 domain-containing protein n=1 Tax=Ilex paraguariensis TaxID=185542 RepID=A0ABC8QWN1_9AQUA
MSEDQAASLGAAIEEAKRRCRALRDRIESLSLRPISSSSSNNTITDSCKRTLLRLVHSELSFLSRFSNSNPSPSLSVNIGHLEAVIHILEQPFVTGVSRVCKQIPLSPAVKNGQEKAKICPKGVHVDIVCTLNGNPVWIIVSDRNPKYISWQGCGSNKGLRTRIEQVLDGASCSVALKPSSIILFFSKGLDGSICEKLCDEFRATNFEIEFPDVEYAFSEEQEGEWIYIDTRSYRQACLLEIQVDCSRNTISKIEYAVKDASLGDVRQDLSISREHIGLNLGSSFCSFISGMKLCSLDVKSPEFSLLDDLSGGGVDLINFDTTALIAIVSGISNGITEKLLTTPETKLRRRFKSNFEFVIAQNPFLVELGSLISRKQGIICETVFSEFKELVSMCGGPNEKLRADYLLKHFM